MNNKKLIIGSHVSLSSPNFLLGSVKESIEYGSNTFMFYTGAPQNTIRKDINIFKKEEAYELMKKNNIDPKNVIVHAPYIINLCSSKIETRDLAKEFLVKEIFRVDGLGFDKLVLHPGSRLDQTYEVALNQIIDGINYALDKTKDSNVLILIETMAGKGSEIGYKIEHIKDIINGIKQQNRIGVCLDTCHISDSGYNIENFDDYLQEFENLIGINKIHCIHVNDSMNEVGSRKDRHQNIGYGKIGFDNLLKVIYHQKLIDIPKILETPYVGEKNKSTPPYKQEITMIKNKQFENWLKK